MHRTGPASARAVAREMLAEIFILVRGQDDHDRGHAGNNRNTMRFRIAVWLAVPTKSWSLQELIDINYITKTRPAIGAE